VSPQAKAQHDQCYERDRTGPERGQVVSKVGHPPRRQDQEQATDKGREQGDSQDHRQAQGPGELLL
jgi:hypothetical protein